MKAPSELVEGVRQCTELVFLHIATDPKDAGFLLTVGQGCSLEN